MSYDNMTCPHCRNEIPRKGAGQHLTRCAGKPREALKRD